MNSDNSQCKLKNFPVSFFSVILGMAGFTIASQKISDLFGITSFFSNYLLFITLFLFILISCFYLIKLIRFNDYVKEEFNHPTKLNFFPTFSISLLLISVAFLPVNMFISKYFWIIGTIIHFIFTIKIISVWIYHTKFEINHISPVWFIPAVGNILVPVSGVSHFLPEISWFFFSIGFIFWVILLVIFLNKIIFYHPLPDKLLPTMFILIAPPAVGFISLVKLTNEINDFSKILYYFSLFLFLLLLSQIKIFFKIKYYLSWWAYSFPLAAINIASILMYVKTQLIFFKYISAGLFFLLFWVIVLLFLKTIKAISAGSICVEEE
jgi:tellurite resistance protein